MIDVLNKCHTDPSLIDDDYLTFRFISLKVQDIHYCFQKVFLSHFLRFYLFEVPMYSTHFGHPTITTPRK